MIFEIKMDFTRKARFVASGHRTEPPSSLTYSSVVARDSVCIDFLLAALNDLELLSADIGNAYLNVYMKEHVHTTCGMEFGQNLCGRTAVIRRALRGLKSNGAAWRSMLAGTLHDMEFKSTLASPDVCIRSAAKEQRRNVTNIHCICRWIPHLIEEAARSNEFLSQVLQT